MKKTGHFVKTQGLLGLALTVMALAGGSAAQPASTADAATASNAAALLAKHAELTGKLAQNQYLRPLFLASSETENTVSSVAYAVLDFPFSTVSATFKQPGRWCDILLLHLNTKYCHASADTHPGMLSLHVGKKTPQRLEETSALAFSYRVSATAPDFLAAQLHADEGPLSTHDYRMEMAAVPLASGKTFIYFRYSYGYGLPGRLAMQTYLATLGRGKVGFTQLVENGKPGYVGGMRGAVERNTMRYYLAIEAYLASLKQAPEQQLTTRLNYWFDATETYSRQLHELDKASYLAMKKTERQQALPQNVD